MSSEAAKISLARASDFGDARASKLALVRKVEVDRSRDALLTDFGKTTLEDRYLLPGESYQDMFARSRRPLPTTPTTPSASTTT